MQANTDRELARTAGKQAATGTRLLLAAGVLLALGLAFMIAFKDANIGFYVGVVLATLAVPPGLAGIALTLSGVVSRRSSRRKPFA